MLTKFRRNKKDNKKMRNLVSILLFVSSGAAVLLIMALLIIGNIRINEKRNELNAKVDLLKKQIQEFQEKEEFLKSQILEIGGDEWLEQKGRDFLDFQKEGEKTFIIKEEN